MTKNPSGVPAWTDPDELRNRLRREWELGRLPAALLRSGLGRELGSPDDLAITHFPLRIALRGPSSGELGNRFSESRAWIAGLHESAGRPGYELETRQVEHRQLGRNEIPVTAVFATADDAIAFIGKKRDADRLVDLATMIAEAFPALIPWLLRRPGEILERSPEWPSILGTLAWFRGNPRSGRYARQVDAPGVHSKFVEARRGLFSELLDLVLDPGAIDVGALGAANFARRYGLRDKPSLVRFRSLDRRSDLRLCVAGGPGGSVGAGGGVEEGGSRPLAELLLRSEDFATLFEAGGSPFGEIFVTENEINYLAFPDRPGAAIILGAGYGFTHLEGALWLRHSRLRYWGDLDSHGFAILDQFRAIFPGAESFLMDRETLLAHRELWTREPKPTRADLSRLKPEEATLYDEFRSDSLAPALRLEQERIRFSWVEAALSP